MPEIAIDRTLYAPIDRVFEVMSDHGRYDRMRKISAAELIRDGDTEKNGDGAVRRLRSGLARFDEEISEFDRPNRFDYLIIRTNLPLHHDGGSLRFETSGSGTRVGWTSTFRITVPVVSGPLNAIFKRQLEKSFHAMLEDAERLAGA